MLQLLNWISLKTYLLNRNLHRVENFDYISISILSNIQSTKTPQSYYYFDLLEVSVSGIVDYRI